MVCKICETELEEGAAFCHQCGERVTQQNVCPNCGKDLPDEAAFCMHCGTNLKQTFVASIATTISNLNLKKQIEESTDEIETVVTKKNDNTDNNNISSEKKATKNEIDPFLEPIEYVEEKSKVDKARNKAIREYNKMREQYLKQLEVMNDLEKMIGDYDI